MVTATPEFLGRLPGLHALLNAGVTVAIALGWLLIRRGHKRAHVASMLSALALSMLFLASYLFYHYHAGSRPFAGQGFSRWIYFPLLISHTLLAVTIVPMVLTVVLRARRGDWAGHRKLARITAPLWLYVGVTGVLVYLMLYRW